MRTPPYKMIYIFGTDGTGKTTHADLVSLRLKAKGSRVWRARVKQHHTLAYLFLRLLIGKELGGQPITYYGFHPELSQKIKTPWKILELISLSPAVIYRVLLPSFLGYIVVCDRYLFDSLATLSYFLKDSIIISGTPARLLVKLIPKNSLLVYLEADTDTILQRKKDEPLTRQMIEYYKDAYNTLIKQSGLKTLRIDTTIGSIEEVQQKIQSLTTSA